MNVPLAVKMAPNSINQVIGQEHLVGNNKILSNLVKNKKVFSMILYGKPGIGKTSIAQALVNDLDFNYRFLNATINNKKDFDIVVEEAKMYNGMILIMDEIHRLNKDKQDLLLPCIESGLITLIGLTTSNPYHRINPAIRSRCQIFELKPLTVKDIILGLKRACNHEDMKGIKINNKTIEYIATLAKEDLRFAYNLLEIAYYYNNKHEITIDLIKEINSKPVFFHDKNGDGHYDVLSALQKSIRGSDVNASLHYLARLILAEDYDSIFRRLSVIAYEDIGLANPSIGPKLDAVINACERLGIPESRIALSNIVIEMALSPKSNSALMAIDLAIKDVEEGSVGEMPSYLKSPYVGYKYPHEYLNTMVNQVYLPTNLVNKKYYNSKNTSKYEKALNEVYKNIEKIKNDLK